MGFFSLGAMPYYRMNFELAMLNTEHQKVMLALQKLPKELSEALTNYKDLVEQTESC